MHDANLVSLIFIFAGLVFGTFATTPHHQNQQGQFIIHEIREHQQREPYPQPVQQVRIHPKPRPRPPQHREQRPEPVVVIVERPPPGLRPQTPSLPTPQPQVSRPHNVPRTQYRPKQQTGSGLRPVPAPSKTVPVLPPPSKEHPTVQGISESGREFLPMQPTTPTPQIVSVDVQCSKQAMQVRIQFDQAFDGVIYSKGHYSDAACRYVAPKSHQGVYEFAVYPDRCGTVFVDQFATGGQAYLENTIVIQNEPHFQEIWDTARRIRCLWTGQFDKTVSSSINVDMLDVISITYSGDSVESYMDIQLGRGPFAAPVSGLVKIGETLTGVVYVQGGPDFDVHVKDCVAHDGDVRNSIQLTDNRGCVIKKKLMGPWQKTRQTGNTGASVVAFAFFQAFKFPDKMEVFIECNIEICKFQCTTYCPDFPGDPRSASGGGRSRREVKSGRNTEWDGKIFRATERIEPVRLLRGIRVVSPEDITLLSSSENGTVSLATGTIGSTGDFCVTTPTFVIALVVVLLILLVSCLMTALLCLRIRSDKLQLPSDTLGSLANSHLVDRARRRKP